MISKMKERRRWNNNKNSKKEGECIDRLTMNYGEKQIKQELPIGIVCEELEDWNAKGRTDLVYTRVVRLTWKERLGSVNMGITDSSGNIVTDPEEVRET